MAEQDVDIAADSDDEIIDLTGDDGDWEDVEVCRPTGCALVRACQRQEVHIQADSVPQDFSDLEQDLEETTAQESRQGKDMQVLIIAVCLSCLAQWGCQTAVLEAPVPCRAYLGTECSFHENTTG